MRPATFALVTILPLIISCSEHGPEIPDSRLTRPGGPPAERTEGVGSDGAIDTLVGDGDYHFRVVSSELMASMPDLLTVDEALDAELLSREVVLIDSVRAHQQELPSDSLVVGFPARLLGESAFFGGLITAVSEPDEYLGNLKLIAVETSYVRPFLAPTESGGHELVLLGCSDACGEASPKEVIFRIPVQGISGDGASVFLDISVLGEDLYIDNLDAPDGNLVGVASRATFVDFSSSTLVFDVESEMHLQSEQPGTSAEPVFVTTRWHLALASRFEQTFVSRAPTPEFGFGTTGGAAPKIVRFSTARYQDEPPIKYYIKHVPEIYRADFSAAFDDWNEAFREVLGYDLLAYEHISFDDPRSAKLVPGDVRYNIMEWDLVDRAVYGGIGVTVANRITGETLSGISYIQGPLILELYTDWFGVLEQAEALLIAGEPRAAERILVEGRRRVEARIAAATPTPVAVRLGDLDLVVPAERPDLHDRLMAEFDFEDTPPGVDFETYMSGYMRALASHELGHTLGLAHNFKGSLSGNDGDVVTHSVMEYVIRTERHKSRMGEYDRQAIAYGYAGLMADNPQPFCTHGDLPSLNQPENSAECMFHDAGPDPFGYLRDELVVRALDLVIGRGLGGQVPVWTVADVESKFQHGALGMLYYAASAEATADTWIGFYTVPGRPTAPEDIRDYVFADLYVNMCNVAIADEIAAKYALNPEAGIVARSNWASLWTRLQELGQFFDMSFGDCGHLQALPF